MNKDGNFYLNGKRITPFDLEQRLAEKARASSDKLEITISPQPGTPVKHVAFVMDIAMRYEINAILTAEEK
jgi:biopolymer transport protein ExbD